MMKILITGGSGLIGSQLTKTLVGKGFYVAVLSREPNDLADVKQYYWNPQTGEIDEQSLLETDCIIHLAGANIAEKRWTKKRREEIISSRVASALFLFQKVKELKTPLKSFISSSAIGWYGVETTAEIYTEEAKVSNHFLGQLCEGWEQAADAFESLGCNVSKVRTGVVFSEYGGALAKITKPIIWGQGAPLGSGSQYMPWVHMDDLCAIYTQLVEAKIPHGIYNAVAPDHITNNDLTKLLAQALEKDLWMPNVPSWALYMLLGKMSGMLLNGSRVSADKLINNGFVYSYPTIRRAIASIIY
jgi:uncharacterized protein (TIGR01777 family)